jgi:hypothetical protein
MDSFEDLFRSYWWLMFPLFWFIAGAWQSLLNLRRHRDTLDLIKTYVSSGREIPPGLLESLNKSSSDDDWDRDDGRGRRMRRYYGRRGVGGWPNVALFGSLALGFGYAAQTDLYEAGPAFLIVTFVMGALCLSSLVATLMMRSPKD